MLWCRCRDEQRCHQRADRTSDATCLRCRQGGVRQRLGSPTVGIRDERHAGRLEHRIRDSRWSVPIRWIPPHDRGNRRMRWDDHGRGDGLTGSRTPSREERSLPGPHSPGRPWPRLSNSSSTRNDARRGGTPGVVALCGPWASGPGCCPGCPGCPGRPGCPGHPGCPGRRPDRRTHRPDHRPGST